MWKYLNILTFVLACTVSAYMLYNKPNTKNGQIVCLKDGGFEISHIHFEDYKLASEIVKTIDHYCGGTPV